MIIPPFCAGPLLFLSFMQHSLLIPYSTHPDCKSHPAYGAPVSAHSMKFDTWCFLTLQ